MTHPASPLVDLAQAHGIHTAFFDLHGQHHAASSETLIALLAALGIDASSESRITDALKHHAAQQASRILPIEQVLPAGEANTLLLNGACEWMLETETGTPVSHGWAETEIPLPALSSGYYLLLVIQAKTTQTTRILARPARAPSVQTRTGQEKCWGMTGALYGLRSATNGGLGNYEDLAKAATSLGKAGAQFFGINPIHALGWAAQDMISPYSPTHRGFFNIDHIAPKNGLGPTPNSDLIDYPAFRARHRAALEAEFAALKNTTAFDKWLAEQSIDLREFTEFETLSETYGPDFRLWPAALRTPGTKSSQKAGSRARFHAWLQWRAETQISQAHTAATKAGMSLGLYLDLAVGPRPGGAEVWMNQDTIAKGVTIGAPPDHLSPKGQSWALAAHAPGPLSAAFYAPLRAMLRKLMAHCGLLRIDHALGLLRSFWLPDDGSPGGYISQPLDSLLAVIAIEAENACCVIVGEDLGLVPDGFREKLNGSGLYSYSVWQYETFHDGQLRPAQTLSPDSLACFGTHDTPTLQGFWFADDIDWWQQVGWLGDSAAKARHAVRAKQRQSLRNLCAIPPMATATGISQAIQHTLAQAPAALLAVQLDDALGLIDAQNLPGTINEHPNWRRRLPIPVEKLDTTKDIRKLADIMPQNRRKNASTP